MNLKKNSFILLNYTGKEIHVRYTDNPGKFLLQLPSLGYAYIERGSVEEECYGFFGSMHAEVFDLPPLRKNTFYIVRREVAELLSSWRKDLCFPYPLVDDRHGIIECYELVVPLIIY